MAYKPGGGQYVGGRATSSRRRQASVAYYDGKGLQTPKPEVAIHETLVDDPGGVECPNCSTRVNTTPTGKPVAHAPGGYQVNIRKGRLRCVPLRESDNTSLRVYTGPEAKERGLVTQAMVVRASGLPQNLVSEVFQNPDFEEPMGTIYHQPTRRFRNLYRVVPVMTHPLMKALFVRDEQLTVTD